MHSIALAASLLLSSPDSSPDALEVSPPPPPVPVRKLELNHHDLWRRHLVTHPRLHKRTRGMHAKVILGSVTLGMGTAVSLMWAFQPDAGMDGPPGPSFYRPLYVSGGAAVSGLFLLTWGLVDASRLRKARDAFNQRIYIDLGMDVSARRGGARAGVTVRF